MNKKILISIVITAGVLLLAVLVLLIIALRQPQPDGTNQNTNGESTTNTNTTNDTSVTTTTSNNSTSTNTNDTSTTNVVLSNERTIISRAAMSFTERYGSYSSDNDFDNIDFLQDVMTDTMKAQAEKLQNKSASQAGQFYSISTQAITVTLVDFSEGATGATVEVDTRRTEQQGLNDPVIFSQTARLQLKKVDATWKVDSFKWL